MGLMDRWPGAARLAAVVAVLLLLCCSTCSAERRFDFKTPGSAKATLGVTKLARIQARSGQGHLTIDELAHRIEQDDDLGVDLDNDLLIYACAGLAVTPEKAAAHQQAATQLTLDAAQPIDPTQPIDAEAAAAVAAIPAVQADPAIDAAIDPAAQEAAAAVDVTGGHHHHHHHRRHLLQANVEWAAPYLPEVLDASITPTLTQQVAFTLHSRPQSTRRIYLDFNGHEAVNTAWLNPGTITTPAFDRDGDPNNWSAEELEIIFSVWREVSEDYAPFDVDITTEEPIGLALSQWTRCVIGGGSRHVLGHDNAGGVAYLNVWGSSNHYYQPAYVFPDQLGGGYPKYLWEAISHEVGHNMGLNHDGTSTVGYYEGHSSTDGGWAPIMGVGYYQPLSQWSKGEYSGANNKEDDYAVISGKLTYVAQSHGTTLATAQALPTPTVAGTVASTSMAGIIRMPTDTDTAFFYAGAGAVTVQALPTPDGYGGRRTNLYLTLELYNAVGTLVARTTATSPSLSLSLAANWYYVVVKGVGNGAAYSSYGSRGQYQLKLTYPYVASPPTRPNPTPPKYVTVAANSFTVSKTKSSNKWKCIFSVTLQDSAGVKLSAATVSGSVTYTLSSSSTATTVTVAPKTASTGVATYTTVNGLKVGSTCSMTITDISLAGYTRDPAFVPGSLTKSLVI